MDKSGTTQQKLSKKHNAMLREIADSQQRLMQTTLEIIIEEAYKQLPVTKKTIVL